MSSNMTTDMSNLNGTTTDTRLAAALNQPKFDLGGKTSRPDEASKMHEYKRTYPGSSRLAKQSSDWANAAEPDLLQVAVLNGKLLLTWQGETEEIQLPEDAYTNVVEPSLDHDVLTVRIARKDPKSPAMVEKQVRDPDFPHPTVFNVKVVGRHLPHPPNAGLHGQPTPAQVERGEHTTRDFITAPGEEHARVKDVGPAATIATDMPVMLRKGGVMEAPSQGETVVRDPTSSDTHLEVMHGRKEHIAPSAVETQGQRLGLPREMAGVLSKGGRPESPVRVVQGTRERVLQADFGDADDSYVQTARAALGMAPVREEEKGRATATFTDRPMIPEDVAQGQVALGKTEAGGESVAPEDRATKDMVDTALGGMEGLRLKEKGLAPEPAPAGDEETADYADEYEDEYYDDDYESGEEAAVDEAERVRKVHPVFEDAHGIRHEGVDPARQKVGMATAPVDAASLYPRADDGTYEPMSSLKKEGVARCDLCDCNPCQCSKVKGIYELTPPELKHSGPYAPKHAKHRSKPQKVAVTNRRGGEPTPPRSRTRTNVGSRVADYSPHDPKPDIHDGEMAQARAAEAALAAQAAAEQGIPRSPKAKGAAYTGGRTLGTAGADEIHLNSGRHQQPHSLG